MDQNNGGILGKINTPTTSVASGVWSLDSQFEAQSSSIWPLAFPQTTIANSCRFDDDSSDYLRTTGFGTPTSSRKMTISFWCKPSSFSGNDRVLVADTGDSNNNRDSLGFSSGNLVLFLDNASPGHLKTNRLFKDPSAWYHIVIAIDTTQSTNTDRIKIYVNGVQETSFDSSGDGIVYPSQNYDILGFGQNRENTIGADSTNGGSNDFYDGYLTEFIFVDGQQLDQTSFGATNPVSNIWEPITYTGTYGNNGFKLNFTDSSALGDDTSGNGNDFTVNNLTSVDQSTDTCSNNFATMNPLYLGATTGGEFLQGNLDVHMGGTAQGVYYSTIGVSTGKWYVEVNPDSGSGGNSYIGISGNDNNARGANDLLGDLAFDYGYYQSDGSVRNNDSDSSYGSSYSNGNIIGVYLDLDNNKLYFSVNGTLQNSGTGVSITDPSSTALGAYFFCVGDDNAFAERRFNMNFGSPIESISSSNTDDNGYGNFEYSPNITGDGSAKKFYALNTKNLAEFG